MVVKVADSKGRVSLGSEFAGRVVIVNTDSDVTTITPGVVIPESEAWLYRNPEALAAVRKGLADAAKRNFSETQPDLAADAAFADSCED